jgi:hypothetical protein
MKLKIDMGQLLNAITSKFHISDDKIIAKIALKKMGTT